MADTAALDSLLRSVYAGVFVDVFNGEPGMVLNWKPYVDPDLELDEGL